MKHILIVDDDAVTRSIIERILQDAGFLTTCVEDGSDALNILKSVEPDLLLTDIFMREVDGLQLIKQLEGSKHKPKIMAMSGGWRSSKAYLQAALEHGALKVIKKPDDLDNLPAIIQEVLDS